MTPFAGVYSNRKVLVTGHTGFKGSWLCLWLKELGADVMGFALPPPSTPSHYDLLDLGISSRNGDIRNKEEVDSALAEFQPEIVFHLAAQALVRPSYETPVDTITTNVMGAVNIFEACRHSCSVRAIVNVTSDKCYENHEWVWGYRENDPMGGHDPYSVSKGCSELLTSSWRNSFFSSESYGKTHQTLLASCRAGNVIGGGDWAKDRLIPDIMRAVATGETVEIRSPRATRPWQHVLEPLSGYLTVGQRLLQGEPEFATSWNFGPDGSSNLSVSEMVTFTKQVWPRIEYRFAPQNADLHEATLLMLDCSKARHRLKWRPVWGSGVTIEKTVAWYRDYYDSSLVSSKNDLSVFVQDAIGQRVQWAYQ